VKLAQGVNWEFVSESYGFVCNRSGNRFFHHALPLTCAHWAAWRAGMSDNAATPKQSRNRRSTWSSGDRPKVDLHVGEEWEQLTPKEREVAAALRAHFGEEQFASIPGDLIVPFIRGAPHLSVARAFLSECAPCAADLAGYAEETVWEGLHFVQQLLADSLAWRAKVGADSTGTPDRAPHPRASLCVRFDRRHPTSAATARHTSLAARPSPSCSRACAVTLPPPGQPEFEQIYQAGPVGHDAEGRAVVLERVGRIPAGVLCATYNEDSIVPHGVFVKEATRALCRDLSERAQRRLYKVVVVIDFKGVGTQHTSTEFLRLFRAYANQVDLKNPALTLTLTLALP